MNPKGVQKAKIILGINFAALFLIVVLTPYYIQEGIFRFSEETMEGVFLTIELLALIFVFRHYDAQMKKMEEQAFLLDVKLKRKERELLGAFEHLGKVNVQVSMIKELFEEMEVPSSRGQLNESYSKLLRLTCSITKEDCSFLRIIDLEKGRTVGQRQEGERETGATCSRSEVGNKELINCFKKRKKEKINGFQVFYSNADNFSLKVFLLVPDSRKKKISSEERSFLEAIANQCEIMFLLFNSKYYKSE